MGEMVEVLFCTDLNNNQASCSAWDYRTGTNLMTYKGGGNIQPHGLSILRAQYVLAVNCAKPLLHVWPINGQEQITAVRFVAPGQVNTMAISGCGFYLVAGIKETIYIWHLTTGRMLNTIAKHYQPINCIRFTDDGSHFISAGQDGSVMVWNLSKVVAKDSDDNQTPVHSFTDHGLPVMDVHVGVGGIKAYIFTVSLDRTCKVYDLYSGALLLSVVFTEGLQSVVTNALETAVYVGSVEGNIYEFNTDALPKTKEYHMEKEHSNKFQGHKAGVTCLAVSLDGQTLVSGGKDNQVCIWHIPSRQLMKTMPQKGEVTNLALRLTNPTIFHAEHKQPRIFCGNLQRMINPPDADQEELIEILITKETAQDYEEIIWGRRTSGIDYKSSLTTASNSSSNIINGPTDEQTVELKKLRAENKRLKAINKKLFDTAAGSILGKRSTKK